MKRIFLLFLCVILTIYAPVMKVGADGQTYHWYCVHVKDHAIPKIAPEMAFIEEYDGFYIGKSDDTDKVIYLTFDAGYENGNVAKILDVLQKEDVKAAFFILGNLITHDTELVSRMASEGHTVCNHTVRHKDMSQFDETAFLEELHALESLYEERIGEKMASFYRPPEGNFSLENMKCAKENGYKTVFWSFAYPDWDNQKQMSAERAKGIVLDNLHNGEIMLLHPTSATNAEILGDVIKEAKAAGYRFGTLDELTRSAS